MSPRRLFVAGSTGVTGRALVAELRRRRIDHVPHIRPRHSAEPIPGEALVIDLSDTERLVRALATCTTVIQLIGTMRKRFASGDTYHTSDIGTTRQLVAAARRAGTIDHFVLLSSVGAGRPIGAYLRAKSETEMLVREGALPFTIFRPSVLVGEGRPTVPGLETLTRLCNLPRYRPIAVETLARKILTVALDRAPLGTALEGSALWSIPEQPLPDP